MFGDNRQRQNLEGLPEDLQRERRAGRVFDPRSGVALDWVNRYKTVNFGVVIGIANSTVLQDNHLRTYLLIQNQHPLSDLFLSFTTEAGAFGSVIIIPRGNYELIGGEAGGSYVPSGSVNLLGAVAAMSVTVVEGTLSPYEISIGGG